MGTLPGVFVKSIGVGQGKMPCISFERDSRAHFDESTVVFRMKFWKEPNSLNYEADWHFGTTEKQFTNMLMENSPSFPLLKSSNITSTTIDFLSFLTVPKASCIFHKLFDFQCDNHSSQQLQIEHFIKSSKFNWLTDWTAVHQRLLSSLLFEN